MRGFPEGEAGASVQPPATRWLRDVAKQGAGQFHAAESAAQLADVFRDIVADILSRTTSFATPSLSVNAFNRLFHRNEVYFSLFVPSDRVRWDGNVKKYQICQSESLGCEVGEVLDFQEPAPGDVTNGGQRDGNPAIQPVTQRLVDDARVAGNSFLVLRQRRRARSPACWTSARCTSCCRPTPRWTSPCSAAAPTRRSPTS